MDFDKIIKQDYDSYSIEYGIVNGNSTIVFIKAGADGSMYGYKNKYLDMARKINEKFGYTVISSSNPKGDENELKDAFKLIEDYSKENGFDDYKIYYMGYSNGGLKGVWYASYNPLVTRLLLINPPLIHNLHKTQKGMKKFNKEKMTFVFGTEDQSYPYLDLIKTLENDKVKIVTVEGEDHLFSKDLEEFKRLPFDYLI